MIELAPEQSTVLDEQMRLQGRIKADCRILLDALLAGEVIDLPWAVKRGLRNHTTRLSEIRWGKFNGMPYDIKQSRVEHKNFNKYWL